MEKERAARHKKGRKVRPVISPGLVGKKFRRVVSTKKRLRALPTPPCMVVRDLQDGSLRTLDAYLKRHGCIPDREVAVALRALLSGSASRSKYRLVVIDHPDAPKDVGGRPESSTGKPTVKQIKIEAKFRERLKITGKVWLAVTETTVLLNVSKSTVMRARKSVQNAQGADRSE